MRITNLEHLTVMSKVNQNVHNILHDLNIGRAKASWALSDTEGLGVSEKLVRTYREKYVKEPTEFTFVPDYDNFITNAITTNTVKTAKAVSKKVIAFGDFQINKHDPIFLNRIVDLVRNEQPDMICLTGDESDNSAVGNHAKGMREEYESNLQSQIDTTVNWLTEIREAAPAAEIHMAHSNHMNWITRAIETRLPGFATLRALTPEKLYQLDELDITYQRQVFEFVPDYVLAHGHQWQFTSASHARQGTDAVRRLGKSLLAGHCHQGIIKPVFVGVEGKGKQLVYANPGCVMDFEKAMESNGGYISGTSPDWSKGIVVITHDAGQNYTELILGASDGSFKYGNTIYNY